MANYYDISKWEERPYFNTGGTRDKCIVQNPENDILYFFKTSLKKEVIDYKYEFWSEIIASEIGILLGFNMLTYDIAYNNVSLGCISENMTNLTGSSLVEGYKLLIGYRPQYDVLDKKSYTFQLIKDTLNAFSLQDGIREIIKIVIFDSIIGNGDRHQENWSFIYRLETMHHSLSFLSIKKPPKPPTVTLTKRFSPIYDSGSCLGREIADNKIPQYLSDDVMIESYIKRGRSEIHWNGEKLNHFDLIRNIQVEHREEVKLVIEKVQKLFDLSKIEDIVYHVDKNLPKELELHKMPLERKKLIIKLITLRYYKLIELIR